MTLKKEIKDAYIEKGAPIYVKTHSNAVYVDDNETETLTKRLDNIKGKIDNNTSQLNDLMNNKIDIVKLKNFGAVGDGVTDDTVAIQNAITALDNYNNVCLIFEKDKKYLISEPIQCKKNNLTVIGNNATIISNTSSQSSMLDFTGDYADYSFSGSIDRNTFNCSDNTLLNALNEGYLLYTYATPKHDAYVPPGHHT